MKTLTIKNKTGRIVTVEHSHWVKLISKGAELIVPETKTEPKKEAPTKQVTEKTIIKTK